MNKQDGFYFIPQKWLGDSNIIAMDWDCKGMHLHLMAIAWQQEKKGYLIDDDNLMWKLVGSPDKEDWTKRIKPQIFSAWKKKSLKENGGEKNYWYQQGMLKTLQNNNVVKSVRKKNTVDIIEDENISDYLGFDLKSLLKIKPVATILYKKPVQATTEEKSTVWTLGVQLLSKNSTDAQARGFIARQIKEFGEKAVASAIAQISLKSLNPADINSYLVGMLKKQQAEEPIKKTGRGSVSI